MKITHPITPETAADRASAWAACARGLGLAALALWLVACDPEHKKKCEWYLMPDQSRIGQVEAGFIPVCARNLVVGKQDCRLQTTLKFAEKVYGKKFRYVDLTVKNFGLPRTIDTIELCE